MRWAAVDLEPLAADHAAVDALAAFVEPRAERAESLAIVSPALRRSDESATAQLYAAARRFLNEPVREGETAHAMLERTHAWLVDGRAVAIERGASPAMIDAYDELSAVLAEARRARHSPVLRRREGMTWHRGAREIWRERSDLVVRDERGRRRVALPSTASQVRVSPDGSAAMFVDLELRLWRADLETGACVEVDKAFGGTSLLEPCRVGVALAGSNSSIVRVRAWSGEALASILLDHPSAEYFGVEVLALSNDGRLLVVCDTGASEEVGMIDEARGPAQTRAFEIASGRCMAATADTFSWAVASDDGTWLMTSRGICKARTLHVDNPQHRVATAAVSIPDTSCVAWHDGTRLAVHDLASDQPVTVLHEDPRTPMLDVSPEGRQVSAKFGDELRAWRLEPG